MTYIPTSVLEQRIPRFMVSVDPPIAGPLDPNDDPNAVGVRCQTYGAAAAAALKAVGWAAVCDRRRFVVRVAPAGARPLAVHAFWMQRSGRTPTSVAERTEVAS